MTFQYLSTEEAIKSSGIRMTVVSDIPSPWGEAAKGLFHVKDIPIKAVRFNPRDAVQRHWSQNDSAPTVFHNSETPISNWKDILDLVETLEPQPSLLPRDKRQRKLALELSEAICGKDGLGWHRRINAIHLGLNDMGGFAKPIAQYLAPKYGYTPKAGEGSSEKVIALLKQLSAQLASQQEIGSPYFLGPTLTCVDIYSATFCALFKPLPDEFCQMRADTRAVFETLDSNTAAALSTLMLNHRDRIYSEYLGLPLSL